MSGRGQDGTGKVRRSDAAFYGESCGVLGPGLKTKHPRELIRGGALNVNKPTTAGFLSLAAAGNLSDQASFWLTSFTDMASLPWRPRR